LEFESVACGHLSCVPRGIADLVPDFIKYSGVPLHVIIFNYINFADWIDLRTKQF